MSHGFRKLWWTALAALLWAVPAMAETFPVGVWQVNAGPDGRGELVIKAIKNDGALEGTIFGKPIEGTWDGTRFSFKFRDVTEKWYEAWLLKETQGTRLHWTLTGVRKFFTFYAAPGDNWYTGGGWYAHLDQRP
jgi:hypothetical protein